jgi:hypothetical protein
MARKKKKHEYYGCEVSPEIGISGFYRVNVVDPDGTVRGDSGWHKNVISNLGLANYIAYAFYSTGGSTAPRAAYMMLGSLASSHASSLVAVTGQYNLSLAASIGSAAHTTRAAQSDGHTVRFYATFVSNSLVTDSTSSIAGIGLYHTNNASSAMCAGTFAGSTLGSNQAVNCSYDIVFSATATT